MNDTGADVKAIIFDCFGVLYVDSGQLLYKTLVRNEPLLQFAQSLRQEYKLGLLSNISPGSMEQMFTAEEREQYFDAVMLSGEVGMVKPDPNIYKAIAEKLGVSPGNCVMIDDSLDNCHGADAAGMRWIHYKSNQQCMHEVALLQ
jgi:FMN phosphatase YigB (HAD superfamily)